MTTGAVTPLLHTTPISPSSLPLSIEPEISEEAKTTTSDRLFNKLNTLLLENSNIASNLVSVLSADIQVNIIHPNGTMRTWVIKLTNINDIGVIERLEVIKGECKVLIICTDDVMRKLVTGELSSDYAFISGDIKIKGSMPVAIKFKNVLETMKSLL